MTCTDCQKTYQAYLSDIPSEWRVQIADLMCKVVADVDALGCPEVKSCETLTSLSPFTLNGGELSITYKDERGISITRTIDLNISSGGDFIQNQFAAAQTPGDFWIEGTGQVGVLEVTSTDLPVNVGISVNASGGGLAITASGVDTTYFDGDGLMRHKGNIFLTAAISAQPAISFFTNSLTNSDYYLQRQGTTLRLHAAGIVALSSNVNIAYTANSNSLQGHEWYSMTSPTNNNLMQLFPDGSLLLMTTTVQQNPDPSALFEMDSTTRGFLPPRMTTAEKTTIAAPTPGLIVYDTTLNKLCVRTNIGWETITSI